MEYTQMTLDEWVSMKESLKRDLIGVQESFVRIGFKLRKIEEQKLYEKDGCKSIAEFAKKEYGLSASTVSRFIAINEKYSIDGYSEQLRPEFLQYGSSKLSEMLALPDGDLEMIRPEATRETIRELKRFNEEPADAAGAKDLNKLIEEFFEKNRDELNEMMLLIVDSDTELKTKDVVEIVNPSGNRVFRTGMYFVTMYDSDIMIKQFGGETRRMSWEEFLDRTIDIFREAAGPDTWKNYFGGEEEPVEPTENDRTGKKCITGLSGSGVCGAAQYCSEPVECCMSCDKDCNGRCGWGKEKPAKAKMAAKQQETKKSSEKKIAPAQEKVAQQEVVEKPFGTRKRYLEMLTVRKMAVEIAAYAAEHPVKVAEVEHWEQWLSELVNQNGEKAE